MAKKKLLIDLTRLEPLDQLDSEEAALHQALQRGEFEFQNDYFAIKLKASALGLPYQALINSLIHQYVSA